ncbi:hypothetical protein QMA0248_0682 [Streptococcus iniae]|nr:hypothetical protein QMA0248_0682 [Streptococcus iniae]ATX39452.1 hypothetical protein CTW00_01271 [Streptococcus iniae]
MLIVLGLAIISTSLVSVTFKSLGIDPGVVHMKNRL